MTKILVCGEGPHDVGADEWDNRAKDWHFGEGWLHPLIRRILGSDIKLVSAKRSDVVLLPRVQDQHKPLPKGHGAKALAAAYFAKSKGCAAIVFMADNDSTSAKDWSQKCSDISAGINEFSGSLLGVPCVPMATSECWLLGDTKSWPNPDERLEEFSNPENLWGERSDPAANHPKHVFRRQCYKAGRSDNRETRRAIAEHISLAELERKCSHSFPPFKADILKIKKSE
jgi:hypothetical protein